MRETHFGDYQKIRIIKTDEVWLNQFLPWAGIIWGRSIRDEGDAYILESKTAQIAKPTLTLSGSQRIRAGWLQLMRSVTHPPCLIKMKASRRFIKKILKVDCWSGIVWLRKMMKFSLKGASMMK
jgi:hypothetical protein